ncbi:Cerato-platanin [Pterulicium gracile]|uniref:Cerato-platanin n=1 Tax=Pterulicium gracile TaxID=1884261 RepID=A0A5C3Q767_9AGAR|nr:Cerato-platanin [Pterula gracilis]
MKFTLATALIALVPFTSALVTTRAPNTVAWDAVYDKGSTNLDAVACSDGANGLKTKGFSTFSSLPRFPLVGAVYAVEGWNSALCGTCWQVTYKNKSIYVLAIDHADEGFVLSKAAMNTLTNNQATQLGRVDANTVRVSKTNCGM